MKRRTTRLAEQFQQLQGLQILLVEDHEINQQVATELLESVGGDVSIANDGHEAIQIVQSRPFDIVLMDVQMPEMDGYTATREIRKLERERRTASLTPHLPIIAMTANVSIQDRESSLQAGMDDYLPKPIQPYKLFTLLTKWVAPPDILPPAPDTGNSPGKFNGPERWGTIEPSASTDANRNAPETDDLRHLPGLNLESGVARMGGNVQRYYIVLQQFSAQYARLPEELASALNEQHFTHAQYLTHTLKGVAGNIGAYAVQKASQALETAIIQQQTEQWQALLHDLRQALAQVIASIRIVAPDSLPIADPPTGKKLDSTTMLPLFEQLRHLLETSDTEALVMIAAVAECSAGADSLPEIGQLQKLIQQYDFDQALKVLGQVFQRFET